MKTIYKFTTLLILSFCVTSLLPASNSSILQKYTAEVPGIGLIMDKVEFDGITLKNLKFENNDNSNEITAGNKFVITKPGYEHTVSVDYELDADVIDTWDFHHFIYGLHRDGPQNCLLHSIGLVNDEGSTSFTLKAPEKTGVYQLRFCHATGYGTFDDVKDQWWDDESSTSETIMGIVIVEDF